MKRIAAVLFHIDIAVNGDQRGRISIIAISYNIIYIEFRAALKDRSISAPQLERRDAVSHDIAESEVLCRRQQASEQTLFSSEFHLSRTCDFRVEIVICGADFTSGFLYVVHGRMAFTKFHNWSLFSEGDCK